MLGLSLGLCTCIIIYLECSYEFAFDSFHADKEHIYRIGGKVAENNGAIFFTEDIPPPAPDALQKEVSGFEKVAGFYPYQAKITIPDGNRIRRFDGKVEGTQTTGVVIADSNYFSIFKYEWIAGNAVTALNKPFRVVLSENTARRYFGSLKWDQIIGKEVVYNDSLKVWVSGIIKDWKKNTDFPYCNFISSATINSSFLKDEIKGDEWSPGNPWIWCFVKINNEHSTKSISAQFPEFIRRHMKPDSLNRFSLVLQPLSDIHFNSDFAHDGMRKASLTTLSGLISIALFILIIAIINFVNLSTAQSFQRVKQIALRKILGSSARNIIVQFLTETFLLCLFAGLLALFLSWEVVRQYKELMPAGLRFNLSDPHTSLFIVSVIVLTSLLAGFYPARVLSAFHPVNWLKGESFQKEPGKWSFRKASIIFQFVLSLVFIICSIVIISQVRYMRYSDLGFKDDAIITIGNFDERDLSTFARRIEQINGVKKVILQGKPPAGVFIEEPLRFKGKEVSEMMVSVQAGNEDLIPFYQMKLIAGRNIARSDSLNEFVINETYSKALGFKAPGEAIGKFLYRKGRPYPVVGVIRDFHESSFHERIKPLVIGHIPENEKSMAVKLSANGKRAGYIKLLIGEMEKLWKSAYPEDAFNFSFLSDSIGRMYKQELNIVRIVKISMLISIFISAMGLFGLIMFMTQSRKKEIGIRKLLGAGIIQILSIFYWDFLILLTIALLIASPVAWLLMDHWLDNFAYRISISWWVFALSALLVLLITILTIGYQSVKAALVNPVESLRVQ